MNSLAIIRAIRGQIFEQEETKVTEYVHGLCFLCYLLFKNQSSPTYPCSAFQFDGDLNMAHSDLGGFAR